jgi:hypothetical protein
MAKKRSWAGCGCPKGSKRISTKGRGRGWACQLEGYKLTKKGRRIRPFVKAVCNK